MAMALSIVSISERHRSMLDSMAAIPRSLRTRMGCIRLVLFIIFLLSAIWTAFIGVLNVAPNATANHLMNTTLFDNGDFWQLPDMHHSVIVAALTGICVNTSGYLYLTWLVVRPDGSSTRLERPAPLMVRWIHTSRALITQALPIKLQSGVSRVSSTYFDLFSQGDRHRKRWILLLEVVEVFFQTITLHQMLDDGFSTSLVVGYVALMVANAFCCFYYITIAWRLSLFREMMADASLDVVFGVVFPDIVLLHAISSFRADLRLMWIRQQFFPAQAYERRARIYSDPAQINIFTTSFESLRFLTPLDLLVKVGFNLLACVRWRRIVLVLRQEHREQKITTHPTKHGSKTEIVPLGATNNVLVNSSDSVTNSKLTGGEVPVVQQAVPAFIGFLFLLYGTLVVVYATLAVQTSTQACAPYGQSCVLHSYRWSPGESSPLCPCLVFIDRDMSPNIQTVLHLPDISANVSLLAEAGRLRTLQIVNRGLNGELPDTLQVCTGLRHLILINTNVNKLPKWLPTSFSGLEYMHIEGQSVGATLKEVPSSLFSSMSSLHTLTLTRHSFPALPSLSGLGRLRTMYLGHLDGIEHLPPFDSLVQLRVLAIVGVTSVAYLPELSPMASTLQSLNIQQATLCCSGFLNEGVCTTFDTDCYAFDQELFDMGEFVVSCYPTELDRSFQGIGSSAFPLLSDTSSQIIKPFLEAGDVCNPRFNLHIRPGTRFNPTKDPCQGVLYRECDSGVCYSVNLGPVLCVDQPEVIVMRQVEIKLGITCDPVEEAWLGCTKM